ncbi:hypothetical protein INT47_008324 [Mucor saturninus]|uniref:Uncharacterized protein n=1 Tax=Mucor saturninus TaxID=64648 RepID=A0A8H7V458_9FUNG|nr:hypothetical protein INT47_008324 [Mucor saturninus]
MSSNKFASDYVSPCIKCKKVFGLWVYHSDKPACPLAVHANISSDTPLGPTELIEDATLESERARVDEKFRATLIRRREVMEKFILEPNSLLQFNCEKDE